MPRGLAWREGSPEHGGMGRPAFELDHLFVCTSVGATEGDRLVAYGLAEGSANDHAGQGSANRRFFFHNAMLELVWVYDPAAAQSPPIAPLHLWPRWEGRNRGACPFGICLRPAAPPVADPPFPTWEYRPPYGPSGSSVPVAANAHVVTEPLLFYIASNRRPDAKPLAERQPLDHAAGLGEITRVTLVLPGVDRPSPELQAVLDTGIVELREGDAPLMELGFDREKREQALDLRPGLQLMLCG